MQNDELIEKLNRAVPRQNQLDMLSMGYYNFLHFGLNTFTRKEWGSGSVPPEKFALKRFDADKIISDLLSTGSRGAIITAKHHDGFCLFQSKFTDYSLAASPYKDGKGDIVKELSDACKRRDFKLGIYLSPWDRHEKSYGTDAYNDFFCNQLTELCTNYGDIFCFWFDGACGEGENGRRQTYDWQRYFAVIRKLQPKACIVNCGEDLRWIGNEHGLPRTSEWSVVPRRLQCYDKVMAESQQKEGAFNMLKKLDQRDCDLGALDSFSGDEACFWPSEMDVPVTRVGWFYNPLYLAFYTRSVKNLADCYCNSVGHNATLLVNVPPSKRGNLPRKFVNRLVKTRKTLEEMFAEELSPKIERQTDDVITLDFGAPVALSKLVLQEDLSKSQRVESFELLANGTDVVYRGTTIGFKQFCLFDKVTCSSLTLKITSSRGTPYIKTLRAFK